MTDMLRELARALTTPLFERVDDVARDTDTHVGWSILLDADECPSYALPWLAQFVGVVLPEGLPEAEQRARIKDEAGFDRGTPGAIIAATRRTLTGAKTVYLRERFPSTAYELEVLTYADQTPDPGETLAEILAVKPAGLVLTHAVLTGQDYLLLRTDYATYQDVKDTFATYDDVRANTP